MSEQEKRLEALKKELQRAYELHIIPYFYIGKCSFDDSEENQYVDVYIGLFTRHLSFEEHIKTHIKKKYSTIVRAVSVEQYTH